MLLEDYFDFLDTNTIRLKGHRLGIEDVLELYHAGYSAEQIALEFPGLSLEAIHATIAYYWHNKQDIDDYLARLERLVANHMRAETVQAVPAVVQRLRASQAKQARQPTT